MDVMPQGCDPGRPIDMKYNNIENTYLSDITK